MKCDHVLCAGCILALLVLWTDAATRRKRAELELRSKQAELFTLQAQSLEQRITIDVLRRQLTDREAEKGKP